MNEISFDNPLEALELELHNAETELWKQATELAWSAHLERGEIICRYIDQFNLSVSETVAYLSQHGRSQRSLEHAIQIYRENWQGTLETSKEYIYNRFDQKPTVRKLIGSNLAQTSRETNEKCKHCPFHCS